jgi:hypothetical protein
MTLPSVNQLEQETEVDVKAIEKEIAEHEMRLLQALTRLAYHEGEALMLVPREENQNKPIGIALSYLCRSDDAIEQRITNELVKRVTLTVKEWEEWAKRQFESSSEQPF